MRVALVVPGGVDPSGEYRVIPVLLAFIGRLAREHEVEVLALRQEPVPGQWELLGARVHNIGTRPLRLRALRALRRAHRERPIDLVHSFWSGAPGMIAVVAGRILGVPSLVHVAGGELVALPEIAYGAGWRGRLRERAVLRAAGRVTAASEPMLARLAALGVAGTRVPLGVDLSAWPPRQPLRRPPGRPPRLIHVASLNRVKDQTTLLSALALLLPAHPGLRMDIVGEDTLGGEIERLARRLGLADVVTFHGFRTQRQLRPLMEQADLMLVSSRHEAGPIVVLEAATVGVPTVGTTVGHLVEWAPEAALTVPIGDARALADTAATVLADEDLRLSLAQAAQAIALREDADFTARTFAALYAALLGRAASA